MYTKNKRPFIIINVENEKSIKVNMVLHNIDNRKNTKDNTLTFNAVRVNSKLTPMDKVKVAKTNKKLTQLIIILFSLLFEL